MVISSMHVTMLVDSIADQVGDVVSGAVKIHGEVAGHLGCPYSGRVVGDAEQADAAGVVLDHEGRVQAFQGRGVDVEEVDREYPVSLGARNVCQASPRAEGGGMRRVCRMRRIVAAAVRCPSRRSSLWMRTTPQVRFSVARRTIKVVSSSLIGGRPGGRG